MVNLSKSDLVAQHTEYTLTAWSQEGRGSFRLQKGVKDKNRECWGRPDTADLNTVLLPRGRGNNEVFNKNTCSSKIPSERKQYLKITQGCVCFHDSVTEANLFITAMY